MLEIRVWVGTHVPMPCGKQLWAVPQGTAIGNKNTSQWCTTLQTRYLLRVTCHRAMDPTYDRVMQRQSRLAKRKTRRYCSGHGRGLRMQVVIVVFGEPAIFKRCTSSTGDAW